MRTTLTLDDDVAARLTQEIRRSGKGMKVAVNEALRRGLAVGSISAHLPPFVVHPHAFGFLPGTDYDRMNQLADELETEAVLSKMRR